MSQPEISIQQPPDEEFECGCKVLCDVVEGNNTVTLDACDDPTCNIKKMFLEEAGIEIEKHPEKNLIFGRKDLTQ